MVDLGVDVGSLKLKNPIMPASGTFSEELADVFDLDLIGAHVTKTITRGLRDGNPTPRVCEVSGSMLNSIGIPSKGVGYFIEKVVPFYQQYKTPLVVSISGNTADEFATLCSEVTVEGVDAIEVNISCPNIEEDGKAFAIRPSSTYDVMCKLRQATHLPLWAKLTPNTGETPEVARAAEEGGADALVVANTILAMAIDIRTRKPKLGNLMGGLSGPSLKPIALRMAYQCARATNIPVIGCGGISNAEDVLEFLIAGATAVQVGTATFIDPAIMPKIVTDLEALLASGGYSSVRDVIGSVIDEEQDPGVVFMEAAP
ncbi:dihydroorotate dehydrogenase [Aerobium aerolatum]|uniref:Dihydroorotate dehydrogenase n=1 Tax=Aquamicrobium aerolatum DSM 21857 TaxID=1121003 RepID=A0A1I3IB85_9HYPH|nr:dihydroorotate dehydrogenase [Aquamicrobium aerolatum]SFI45100.1 dihydroorotate dehydrogenase (NAD+) catalytic subunit [Aquamicrobium aerolatum DSM 21857]